MRAARRSPLPPRRRINGWVWLLPMLAVFGVFYAVPLARMVYTSVDGSHLDLKHYAYLWREESYAAVLWITFRISIYVTLATLIVGYPIAYYLTRLRGVALTLGIALVLLPFWTSVLVRNYAWYVLLARRGVINAVLLESGLVSQPLSLLFNETAVVIGMTYVLLPFMVLSIYSVARNIEPVFLKASATLGASPLSTFWRVFFPLSLNGVYAGALLVLITAIGFFITPALLGGGRVPMIAVLIESQVRGVLNFGVGSALGTLLLVTVLALYYLFDRVLGVQSLLGQTRT